MKKVFRIFFAYLVAALIGCIIYSFIKKPLPDLLKVSVTKYKICKSLFLFCSILPSIVITGFAIAHAISFGRNPEGSNERFSSSMFERFRNVMIVSVLCAFLLTFSREVLMPVLSASITKAERLPLLVQEYVRAGRQMNIIGRHELAYQYGLHAAKLDPKSEEALLLIHDTELLAKESRNVKSNENVTSALSEEGYTVSQLRKLAESAFQKEEWFNAHYYAQTGVLLASERDTNYESLRNIASSAWNKLSDAEPEKFSESAQIFKTKFEGYTALMQGDDVKAYYIFTELSEKVKSKDPDIERFLKLAKERVTSEYFFIDEMLAKQDFESAQNILFSLKKPGGEVDIVFIKGVTPVTGSVGTVQYLRDFSIYSLDRHGTYKGSLHVPYAKMLQMPLSNFDEKTKLLIEGGDENSFIPYVLLTSIDRHTRGVVNSPSFYGAAQVKNQMVLPILYDNFLILSKGVQNTETLSLFDLKKFVPLAKSFGYAHEVYESDFASRMLYPLFIVLVLLYVATFAWNYRLGEHSIFKLSWTFAFPFFSLVAFLLYKALFWFFDLVNLVVVSSAPLNLALFGLCAIYFAILVVLSIFFVYRKV
ncbi:MAG: hypothetical protein IKI31_06100 [Treponema sp.]|nr:hypothetical protein [Treponema sp.]